MADNFELNSGNSTVVASYVKPIETTYIALNA